VARVRLVPGTGKRTVNGVDLDRYFARITLSKIAMEPLLIVNSSEKFDLQATVHGGGLSGQAGAVSLGVARALQVADASLRGLLGKEGFLTRDARMKERKKYGQAGARKRFQFSKR
jgi:small subunit ribosomal protein S9